MLAVLNDLVLTLSMGAAETVTRSDYDKTFSDTNVRLESFFALRNSPAFVLSYPPEKTGLHLHGINESIGAFITLPQASVDAFAAEWGFIQTPSALESFTSECAKTGRWNGEAVDGFVVRTPVTKPPGSLRATTRFTLWTSVPFQQFKFLLSLQ